MPEFEEINDDWEPRNLNEALDYLERAYVIEPTVADEAAATAIDLIRHTVDDLLAVLERIVEADNARHQWYDVCRWCGTGAGDQHKKDCIVLQARAAVALARGTERSETWPG